MHAFITHVYKAVDWEKLKKHIGTKCNSLTQQFIAISTTTDTWATCFDSI